jgi:hypothetical protein
MLTSSMMTKENAISVRALISNKLSAVSIQLFH